MSDPVAEKSGFLKMYMSSHPDTLIAYAKYFGKVKEPISSAEMTAIDTKVRPYLMLWDDRLANKGAFAEHDVDLHDQRHISKESGCSPHQPASCRI